MKSRLVIKLPTQYEWSSNALPPGYEEALDQMYKFFLNFAEVASYPTNQNSIIRKNFTLPFLKYKRLKLKLRVFSANHSVAMVTYCVTKIMPTCAPVIGQFFDTMIVASIDKEW